MRKLWGSTVKIRQTILAVLFCCALLGVGVEHFAGADSSDPYVMRLFAQDEDSSQPESPIEAAESRAASQPESPLEPKDGEAAAQPDSPLEKPEDQEAEEIEPTATEAPTKTPEPTATTAPTTAPTVVPTQEPTTPPTPAPTATALPTVAPTEIVVPDLEESTQVSVTELLSTTSQVTTTTQLPLIASSGQDQSGSESSLSESGENVLVQVDTQRVGSQPVQVVPIEVSDLLSLLVSSGTNPLFLTENLILMLLCLVGFSITWLGLCALSVCLFYIRSRQSSYIRDYAGADRHMVVHYRR